MTHRPSSRDTLQNNLRVAVKTSNDDKADDWDDDRKVKLREHWNNNDSNGSYRSLPLTGNVTQGSRE